MTTPAGTIQAMYTVSAGSGAGATLATIRAASVEDAAAAYARRQYRGATALRVTGSPGLSGVFQAYTPTPEGGLTSRGVNFHVSQS